MNRRLQLTLVALGLAGTLGAGLGTLLGDTGDDTRESDETLVSTDAGSVRGATADGYRTFDAIPYAAPPVGDLRWRPPQPPAPWTAPRDATRPGPLCAQTGDHLGAGSLAEDCLYLNVTSPQQSAGNGRRPVLVWLHGGSFKDGGGHLYRAQRLAVQGGLVVVTVNYRLGALGFLAHPLLGDGGNFGLADQQAALHWVRRNATAFGGDPHNVTLAGESAGAISVCAHLAAPSSAGLFHRAITQSAPCVSAPSAGTGTGNGPRPREQAEQEGRRLLDALNLGAAPTAARLRDPRLTPEMLLAAANTTGTTFGPVTGGDLLPTDPGQAIAGGRINRVPVLHGINRDEQRLQVWGYETGRYQDPIPAAEYPAEIRRAFGTNASRVLRQYPLDRYASASHALAAALTDAELAASTVDTARALGRHVPTFTYEFADDDAPWFRDFPRPYPMGAYHAAELPYLFDVGNTEPLTDAQRRLADRMIGQWSAFARDGDPGGWDSTGVRVLSPTDDATAPDDFAGRHHYSFWSTVRR
ncbi:carboxylesterase family protein [Actinoplanes sp. NEAU-A12]|uniref:Carboxylic ester hydrolase n=1 Tax=Actinoplanes sandaracinus TaxID=3045177 RepID=A0ABT6X0A3_9ACTN|nr:carboxylesterase family protein [Actinoplanes sandaracinus]MDI6105436.1 carboxylesterase family protein [Actinoplanes sandaracinus]